MSLKDLLGNEPTWVPPVTHPLNIAPGPLVDFAHCSKWRWFLWVVGGTVVVLDAHGPRKNTLTIDPLPQDAVAHITDQGVWSIVTKGTQDREYLYWQGGFQHITTLSLPFGHVLGHHQERWAAKVGIQRARASWEMQKQEAYQQIAAAVLGGKHPDTGKLAAQISTHIPLPIVPETRDVAVLEHPVMNRTATLRYLLETWVWKFQEVAETPTDRPLIIGGPHEALGWPTSFSWTRLGGWVERFNNMWRTCCLTPRGRRVEKMFPDKIQDGEAGAMEDFCGRLWSVSSKDGECVLLCREMIPA